MYDYRKFQNHDVKADYTTIKGETYAKNHKPTQPSMPPISIGGGIGEQRGENKRTLFTLN